MRVKRKFIRNDVMDKKSPPVAAGVDGQAKNRWKLDGFIWSSSRINNSTNELNCQRGFWCLPTRAHTSAGHRSVVGFHRSRVRPYAGSRGCWQVRGEKLSDATCYYCAHGLERNSA